MVTRLLKTTTPPSSSQDNKNWSKALWILGAIIVIVIISLLILPAVTQEMEPLCGKEEHIHEESCYTRLSAEEQFRLVCPLEPPDAHPHKTSCFANDGTIICEAAPPRHHLHDDNCYTVLSGHAHSETCYGTEPGELTCALEEDEGHAHGNACYGPGPNLVCSIPESHQHTESCFGEPTLSCTLEENHIHDELLCWTDGVLTCPLEEAHTHTETCFSPGALTCSVPEMHQHLDSCYEQVLTCTLEEREGHAHAETCYEQLPVLVCTLEETPIEKELTCTMPENAAHEHTIDCYVKLEETFMTCTNMSAEHIHTEFCFWPWSLTCQLEEHTHITTCFADRTADTETAEIWEQTFADVVLTGVYADDLIAIARTQLGYRESEKNYIIDEDGESIKGYTRYGAWYGHAYGDWCAMFASFCLHYANIDNMPLEASCKNWIVALEAEGKYRLASEYTPVPGDLIFFDLKPDGLSDHVGIVETVSETGLTTIEGNYQNSVVQNSFDFTHGSIMGYGVLPAGPDMVNLLEQELQATIYTDETYTTVAEDSMIITVSGLLPEGATVCAYKVPLNADLIDGETLLLAYDIKIFDADGNPVDQSVSETPFTVSFMSSELSSIDTTETTDAVSVYYIPEEGSPEAIGTDVQENAVIFQTEHFSTYAITVRGTMDNVYLNGVSGSDSAAGTQAAPVQTLDRALALVSPTGTIHITGTVTISTAKDLSLTEQGLTIKRGASFTDPLIVVSSGGSLSLGNITINGGSGAPNTSYETNTSYASNSAKAPLIVVNSGGSLYINSGAVLEYNSNKPNTNSSGRFTESTYIGQGGAVYCTGSLTMAGGIIQYCEAQSGGGIYVENGNFTLLGGTITNNYARDIVPASKRPNNYYKNAGGGVYVGDNSTMNMSGGTISSNYSSREGGGISLGWLNRSNGAAISSYITTFNMTGGTITNNTAVSTGGGINVTAGRQAFISAGYITNNTAMGHEYQDSSNYLTQYGYANVFSGGGIYLDAQQLNSRGQYAGVPGYAVINRVVVTNNTASQYGGGIGSCTTSDTTVTINISLGNGTALYGNDASVNGDEIAIDGGGVSSITNTVLGGGSYNWSKTNASGWECYDNSLTANSTAIKNAYAINTVTISGNSGLYGGGIGCNGILFAGGDTTSTSVSITKTWDDMNSTSRPEYITVQLLRDGVPYGDPIKIYRTYDENQNEVWPTYYFDGLPQGSTYTVEEITVPGYTTSVTTSGTNITITNTAEVFKVTKEWVGDEESDRPGVIQVQLYQNGVPYGNVQELTAENDWSYFWPGLPEKDENGIDYTYSVEEISVPDGYYCSGSELGENGTWVITNTKIPTTTVSVEKRWVDDAPGADSVQIQLQANGTPYGSPVTLNAANQWFYLWTDLPQYTVDNIAIEYTITELPLTGYTSSVSRGDKNEADKIWSSVTSLTAGNSYLLVTGDSALASSSGDQLQLLNVSEALSSGTLPANTALWTYSGGKLVNGAGQYLAIKNFGSLFSASYRFYTASSGSNITYSQGLISASAGILFSSTYYLGALSDGYASGQTSSANAIQFTAYALSDSSDAWGDLHFIVTNTPKPNSITVSFTKRSTGVDQSGNQTLLAGATIELYLQDDAGTATIPGTSLPGTLVDSWTSEDILSGTNGIHTVDLSDGVYYLIETAAPAGHQGLLAPIIFEVNGEAGEVTITQYPEFSSIEPMEGVLTGSETGIEIPIYNEVQFILPETGETGPVPFIVTGVILVLFAGAFLIRKVVRL